MSANIKYLYLMIKTHKTSGLKYLCKKTTNSDKKAILYKGSGKYWKRHLKIHGREVDTEILVKYPLNNINAFSKVCLEYSNIYNVVDSDDWANLIEENGLTGAVVGINNPSKRADVNFKKSKSLTGKYCGEKGLFYGRKHTMETIKKISDANKGDNNVMRRNLEARAKMIATKNTEEYKNATRMRSIEINSRPDVKEKIRQSKLGNKNPSVDKKIYVLKYISTNDTLEGTRFELVEKMKILNKNNQNIKILSNTDIGEFNRKNRKVNSVKGWIKLEEKI